MWTDFWLFNNIIQFQQERCEVTICVSSSVRTPRARDRVVWTFLDTANTFNRELWFTQTCYNVLDQKGGGEGADLSAEELIGQRGLPSIRSTYYGHFQNFGVGRLIWMSQQQRHLFTWRHTNSMDHQEAVRKGAWWDGFEAGTGAITSVWWNCGWRTTETAVCCFSSGQSVQKSFWCDEAGGSEEESAPPSSCEDTGGQKKLIHDHLSVYSSFPEKTSHCFNQRKT